jgi:YbbR domain-containing protein
VTRLLGFVVHNWPLKVAAVVLASLLYGVLVLARDAQQMPVAITIEPRGQSDEAILLSTLGLVTRVRYVAPPGAVVNSDTFVAWVDLDNVTAGDGTRTVDVRLEPVDPRVRALEWEPRRVRVELDEVTEKSVPIRARAERAEGAEGLEVGQPDLERERALVRGAARAVDRVDRVEARLTIGADAVDVDRDIQLLPVDVQGTPITGVDVQPSVVRVRIGVLAEGETKTVPVVPERQGDPAPGFEVDTITVEPNLVTVEGDADAIAALRSLRTEPIFLTGASRTVDTTVSLVLGAGIVPVDVEEVRVVVTLRPKTGTRTIEAGLGLVGESADRTYRLSVEQAQVVIGGSQADIDRFQPEFFQLDVPVAGLSPGIHNVTIEADLPAGVRLESVSPETVEVTIGEPAPAPSGVAPSP